MLYQDKIGQLLNESGIVVTFLGDAFSIKTDQLLIPKFMDTLQIQISELRDKIDKLYELVERISQQVQGLSTERQKPTERESYSLSNFDRTRSRLTAVSESEHQLTHKDILVDDNSSTSSASSSSEQNLSPDIQIRRLTAQLTAAYNRIAALEEQLLTYRIHS